MEMVVKGQLGPGSNWTTVFVKWSMRVRQGSFASHMSYEPFSILSEQSWTELGVVWLVPSRGRGCGPRPSARLVRRRREASRPGTRLVTLKGHEKSLPRHSMGLP